MTPILAAVPEMIFVAGISVHIPWHLDVQISTWQMLFMDVSQPLSPAIPVLAQWAHEQSDRSSKMNAIHGLSNMNVHSLRLIWL